MHPFHLKLVKAPRNAVLPQFLTWLKHQVGTKVLLLKVSGYKPGILPPSGRFPCSKGIDHKTLLAVTNAAEEPSLILAAELQTAHKRREKQQGSFFAPLNKRGRVDTIAGACRQELSLLRDKYWSSILAMEWQMPPCV